MVSQHGLRQRQQVATRELLNFFIVHNTVTAQTGREENVKNKNQTTTTHVVCKQQDNGREPDNTCSVILTVLDVATTLDLAREVLPHGKHVNRQFELVDAVTVLLRRPNPDNFLPLAASRDLR